jgi:uncharacterized protein (DUF1810 family)
MADLSRFHEAQAGGGIERALAELRAGRKHGHWIWYVLPQLAGLGCSGTARHYGIQGRDEAIAYAEDPVLRERLLEALRVIRDQLVEKKLKLSRLMGSELDAMKLVSCATLFEIVGRAVGDGELELACTVILDTAARKGVPRCDFTLREMMRPSAS